MLDNKRKTPFIALIGAVALMASAPAFAQEAAAPAAPAAADAAAAPAAPAADAAATAAPAADAAAATGEDVAPAQIEHAGKLTVMQMFLDAEPVVKVVMIGLVLASILSWTLLVTKLLEFSSLNKSSDRFVEAFRGAKSVNEMGRIALSDEFEGNPLADMAAAATQEVELSRQAGLAVNTTHRETTLHRAEAAVGAVQANLGKRLSSGMQFLASVGSGGPFIGLFGTVYGIMNSFIGIANTNTTNLAVVAPGIAEALLATGIGLFAAIPAVIFYNYFQTRISAYGARTEGFVAELMNAISRQLDKGA
ncbi:flagellar motor protein MotA [Phenylobacterium sp. Root77]|jgi:biopolymer transport protein ExbB|uniref:tonB-system energizer ExbB n=1 Tax=unclassified Phenylobacterium TaxID=2640670 RepID=UPI0006F6090A|nr:MULTISPECIES: tonB-system energizer ExbB [unclassified Phenylobacterium]KQW66446.1 flagellar motor protein MotA [Phenylobacterium sp. Root1277]KQW88952.1 flagellar motor protein MotA [Phenylobacterium sp. Root1290]KRC42192.1 flagellar motor protein MotA [Phenylobacterium sp. Root77]